MRTWPGLLVAPLLVLAEQGASFALTPFACARQAGPALHAVAAGFAVVALLIACNATLAYRRAPLPRPSSATMALGMAWFSWLILLALWLPLWVLDPCRA